MNRFDPDGCFESNRERVGREGESDLGGEPRGRSSFYGIPCYGLVSQGSRDWKGRRKGWTFGSAIAPGPIWLPARVPRLDRRAGTPSHAFASPDIQLQFPTCTLAYRHHAMLHTRC